MICPNCNCELVDGTAVCPYCGTPLAAPAPSATATATMPAIQSAPPAAPAPSPAYRAEDIPVSAAPQPAARGAHEQVSQVSQSPEPPFAYGREEAAESPASPARDPYEDYYRQAPARPSAQAYREPAPQPACDPYEDYYRPIPGRGGQGPAARDPYGEPAASGESDAYAYGKNAYADTSRDPYEDYYRQSQTPARPSAPSYREPAPQPARDPYNDYRDAGRADDADGRGQRGQREESREDVRAEGRDARRQQKLNAKAAKARKRRERAAEKAGKKKGMKRLLPTEDYPGTLVLRADKCTQDALGYELLCEDGTVKLQQGVYSRVVEFQDASFQAARESEQREIYENWSELLNTFDNTVHLQVKILCRVIDRDAFREDTFLPPVEGDYAGNRFRRDINQIIESKVAETQQNVERRRLFIVTVEAPTSEQASPLLARATEQVMRSLKNMGVNSEEVRGNELLRIIDSITNPRDPRGFVSFDDLKVTDEHGVSAIQLGYTTKDLVAPADLTKIDDTHISWNGVTGQALYLQKWAGSVRSDMISSLAELPINQVITLDMTSWEQSRAIETIESMNTDLKVQKSDYVLKHSQTMYITDEMLPTNLQDAMENARDLRDDLVSRDQKMWSLTCTTMTWADSLEDCDENSGAIQDVFRRFTCRAVPLVKLQRQGFAAMLPTGRCDIPYVRNLTHRPARGARAVHVGRAHGARRHVDGPEPDVQELHLLQSPRRRRAQRLHPGQAGPRQVGDGQEHDPVDASHRPHRRGHRARPRARVHQRRARDGRRGRPDLRRLAYLYQPVRSRARGGRTAARDEGRRHHVDGRDDGQEPLADAEDPRGPLRLAHLRPLLRHPRPARHPHADRLLQHAQPAARARGTHARRHHRALRHRPGLAVQPPDQREHAQALRRLRHPRLRRQHEGPGAADPARPDVEPHRAQPRAPRPHLGVHRRDAAALRERLRDLRTSTSSGPARASTEPSRPASRRTSSASSTTRRAA